MSAYYNEIDPYAAQWLRNLIDAGHIAPGDVDERSIEDVRPDDLRGFAHHHFFAGIGGWSLALRLAGWPDDRPIWTGSCPCQILSSAARGRNTAPDLWPAWLRLITASRPRTLFGEQVAHKGAWLDRVCDDLGALDYQVGAAVLKPISIGKDHTRPRIYFVGHANGDGEPVVRLNEEMARLQRDRGVAGSVVPENGVSARMAILGAFGNAIVPPLAAEFIAASVEAMSSIDAIQPTER